MVFSILSCAREDRRRAFNLAGAVIAVVGVLLLVLTCVKGVATPLFLAGYCAVFASLMSFFLILEHLSCFSDPECQTKIVRILFMVPLYAMISFVSMLAPGASTYLNLIRDVYESYVIYCFFQLMIALMGGTDTIYRSLMAEEQPPVHHVFPMCCLAPIKVSPTFVQNCRLCIFQFMIIKPLVTVIIVILTAKGQMGTSLFDITKGSFWTTLVYNTSITIAFTALLYFYIGLKHFMEGRNALMKFLCIKAVIFLSFWQGLLIQILAMCGWLPQSSYWSEEETPERLQDLLICVEMMAIAFWHRYCFGSDEYNGSCGTGDAFVLDEDATSHDDLQPRTIPPIRYSVVENMKYTLRHEDLLADVNDILHNR